MWNSVAPCGHVVGLHPQRPLGVGRRVAVDRYPQGRDRDHQAELAARTLEALGLVRERLQRGAIVGDGLVGGVAIESGRAGERMVGARPRVVVPAREVHRQLRCVLGGPATEPRLLAQPDGAVEADTARLPDALVEHAPVQRVHEPVAAGHRAVRPLRDAGIGDQRALRRERLTDVLDGSGVVL